jgi:hypothetical protein
MAIKTYQAFTPPSPYEQERRKAEQMRRYAELLQEQAMAEDEPYTYQGIRAMPSPAAALGKLLKAYGAKKASEKADEAEARKAGMEQQASQQIMGRLFGGVPMSQADTTPDESGLAEVAVQSQYRQDPTDAMRFAATPQGVGAMKGNPMLAAMLQRSMETPKEAEYGTTPQYDDQGRAYVVNKAGNVRFLDNVKAPEKTTSLQDDFKFAQKQGYKGSFEQFRESNRPQTNVYSTTAVAGVDDKGNPVFFQTSPTGGSPMVVPGVKPKPEAPGAEESKSALFADRMSESAPLLDILPPPSITASAKSKTPFVGNVLTSPKNKQFNQAAINFISAVLRKESGANIPDSEIESQARIYIPMAGDDPVTLEQKRRARESAIRGLSLSAGPSYKPVPINPPKGVTPQEWAVMTLDERRKFAQ